PGNDFLAQVCKAWEAEARKHQGDLSIFRISPVLSRDGGAFPLMLPAFKLALGGPLGSGEQWMSWIHIEDLSGAMIWALKNKKTGTFNGAAPEVLRNKDFSRTLSKALHRPLGPKAPKFALKLALGEAADAILASQRATPAALLRE